MKASFSLTSLHCASPIPSALGDHQDNDGQMRHLSLPRSKRRDNWQRSWENKDEFWEALQTNYDYLMNEELIATCKAANGELDQEESSHVWPYQDFLREYAELREWLRKLESECQKAKSENSVESLEQQMINNVGRRKNFNDQAHRLRDRYPDMKSEIHDKINELNNCWDTLAHNVIPRKPREETNAIRGEIECRLRCLRKWLRDMEGRLHLLCVQPGLALEDIQEMLIQQQVLQREIESCNGFAAVAKLLGRLLGCFTCEPEPEAGPSDLCDQRTRYAHWERVARNLERHWHDLWLRSLEKQCALEQLLGSQGLNSSCTSLNSSGCDEPLTKFPRLGGSGRKFKKEQQEEEKRRHREEQEQDDGRSEEPVLKEECKEEPKKAKRGRKDVATECGPGLAVSSKGVMVGHRSMALPQSLADRPSEPVDVGYSSESSTHLSNDEGVCGESVRVYTYPTPDNTKPPHILNEVVLDDGHNRRKIRGSGGIEEEEDEDTLRENLHDGQVKQNRGANCGVFDFKHVDTDQSDIEGHKAAEARRNPVVRRLDLEDVGSDHLNLGAELDSEWSPCLDLSEDDFEDSWEYGFVEDPIQNEDIRRLVDGAEEMVMKPNKSGSNQVSEYSSCDASGESTSSDAEEAEECNCAEMADEVLEQQPQSVVVMRTNSGKKKRGAERPWSVGEPYRKSREYADEVQRSFMSISVGELNLISSNATGILPRISDDWPSTRTSTSSVKRRRRRRSRLLTDSQSGSDGTSVSANTAVGISSDPTASPRRRRWSQTVSSNNTSRSHSLSRSVATDADTNCVVQLTGEQDPGETTAATDGHVSSHSEQAWDNYQEGLYPSEHYSEQELDDSTLWGVLDFGDDYRVSLESQSDGTSTPCCCMSAKSAHMLHTAQHRRQQNHHPAVPGSMGKQGALRSALDSDSDVDDLDHVFKDTGRNLREVKNVLFLCNNADFSSPANHLHYNEVLATCDTNLKCLLSVLKGLGEQQKGNSVICNLHVYIREWEKMRKEAQQQQQYQLCLKGFQKELSLLDEDIRATGTIADEVPQTCQQLERYIAKLDVYLKCLKEKKEALAKINAKVNSFVNETGKDMDHLKKAVRDCYDSWHGSHAKMGEKISNLRRLQVLWVKTEKELQQLQEALDQDASSFKAMTDILGRSAKRSGVDKKLWQQVASAKDISDIMAVVNGSEDGVTLSGFLVDSIGREETFVNLKAQLREMRELLGVNGMATFTLLEERVRKLDADVCRQKLTKETLQLQVASLLEKSQSITKQKQRVGGKGASGEKPRRSRLWRVLRAALPIQLAVVLLLCIACLLEPRCCDSVNNLNLSLTPQLRYVRGPPPI